MTTRTGYAGGQADDPSYRSIGDHSEAVRIEYDPSRISYADLLAVFWGGHDPFGQAGSRQYQNVLFYTTDEQKRAAEAATERIAQKSGRKVKTRVERLGRFTSAEDYHQKYYLRNERTLVAEFAAMGLSDAGFVDSTAAARVNGILGGFGEKGALGGELDRYGLSAEATRQLERRLR